MAKRLVQIVNGRATTRDSGWSVAELVRLAFAGGLADARRKHPSLSTREWWAVRNYVEAELPECRTKAQVKAIAAVLRREEERAR